MNKIKDKRIELGLTQQQLSDLTGVPFRTIQNWETGQRKCPDYVERLLLEKLDRLNVETAVYHIRCNECGVELICLDSVKDYLTQCPYCSAKIDK